jgi:hypothetical protein
MGIYAVLVYSDSWGFGDKDQEVECEEGGKKFGLSVEVIISFTTYGDCELNGDSHKWSKSKYQKQLRICDVCGAYKVVGGANAP